MCKKVLKCAVWAVSKQGLECVGHRQKKKGTLKTESLQNTPGPHTGLWGDCVEPGGHCSVGHHPPLCLASPVYPESGVLGLAKKTSPFSGKKQARTVCPGLLRPNPEQSLGQGGGQSCTWDFRGVEGIILG